MGTPAWKELTLILLILFAHIVVALIGSNQNGFLEGSMLEALESILMENIM